MAFTTWAALRLEIQNSLADGSWKTKKIEVDDTIVEFTELKDVLNFLEYVKAEEQKEAGGLTGFNGRTVAKSTGDGLI